MRKNFRFLVLLTIALCGIQKAQAQAPSSLQYPTPSGFIANVTSVFLSPTYAGATATSFSITPALPAGLSFNTNTGVISGIPTAISPSTNYSIAATNGSGVGRDTIAIAVSNSFFNNNFSPITFKTSGGSTDTNRKVGNGQNAGDIILYRGITTVSGQVIDCIVKTIAVTNVSSWNAYDQQAASGGSFSSNNDNFFSPQVNFSAAGSIIFNFQFIAGGTYNNASQTGINITLQNVSLNTYDIDGNGTAGANQYNRFNGFDNVTLGGSSTIQTPTLNTVTGLTQFRSSIDSNSSVVTADATRVKLSYTNMSNFTMQAGADGPGLSFFFLDFSSGPTFTTQVVNVNLVRMHL